MTRAATSSPDPAGLTRRDAVRRLTAVVAGIAAAGCTPLRIALKDYPEEFGTDPALVERTLRAFALTVVPGAAPDDPALTRVFSDRFHPFGPHRGFFAADLCRRARDRFACDGFAALPPADRVWVVRRGLRERGIVSRMYAGAVLLVQVAVYAAIYDDAGGSPLIGFPGRGHIPSPADLTYPDTGGFLARPLTDVGHPA